MENKFVIALNHTEFKSWYELRASEIMQNDIRLVYVVNPDILRGHINISGYLVGRWYKRDDIGWIILQIRCNNRQPPNLHYDVVKKCPYRFDPITDSRIDYI